MKFHILVSFAPSTKKKKNTLIWVYAEWNLLVFSKHMGTDVLMQTEKKSYFAKKEDRKKKKNIR